jgi:hypothetical protein
MEHALNAHAIRIADCEPDWESATVTIRNTLDETVLIDLDELSAVIVRDFPVRVL